MNDFTFSKEEEWGQWDKKQEYDEFSSHQLVIDSFLFLLGLIWFIFVSLHFLVTYLMNICHFIWFEVDQTGKISWFIV